MPKMIEIPVFTFAELNEKAKEKARYDFLNIGCDFNTDSDLSYWTNKLEKAGFNLESFDYSIGGQGDYVAIIGRYRYRKGWKQGYITEYGIKDNALSYLLELQDLQSKVFYDFDLVFSVSRYGYQYVEQQCIGTIYPNRWQTMPDGIFQDMKNCIKGISDLILSDLKSDYDYVCSLEHFSETCDCNEWTFLESGELFHV